MTVFEILLLLPILSRGKMLVFYFKNRGWPLIAVIRVISTMFACTVRLVRRALVRQFAD